jgi:hypothetical protein
MISSTTPTIDDATASLVPGPKGGNVTSRNSGSSNTRGASGEVSPVGRSFQTEDLFLAASARRVGRLSAATISRSEEEELHEERQRLLDRKFAGTLTRSEANRLSYVRWSLDRIEDARIGPVLDEIETKLLQYEKLARDIASLKDILQSSNGPRRVR